MSCPKCGYSGHNTVSHWGTGEIECENCRHDYVPKKSRPETPSKFMSSMTKPLKPRSSELECFTIFPLSKSSSLPSAGLQCPNPLGEEMVLARDAARALQRVTGMDTEAVFRACNGLSRFSSVLEASKNLIGGGETARMLSDELGWEPERAWREVNGPKLNY